MGKLHFLYMIDLLNENSAKIVSCMYFYFLVSAAGEWLATWLPEATLTPLNDTLKGWRE